MTQDILVLCDNMSSGVQEGFIRDVRDDDVEAIHGIYAPFVRDTAVSFEYDEPSIEEMRGRINTIKDTYPYLVWEGAGGIIGGYAYASQHKDRKAYQWVCETSVYLAPSFRGKGIAKRLMSRLINIITAQGFVWAHMGISGKNEASERLHVGLGFELLYNWKLQGNKFGNWIDVNWYKKLLIKDYDFPENPKPPVPYSIFREQEENDHNSGLHC